jgi:hypothetical protein
MVPFSQFLECHVIHLPHLHSIPPSHRAPPDPAPVAALSPPAAAPSPSPSTDGTSPPHHCHPACLHKKGTSTQPWLCRLAWVYPAPLHASLRCLPRTAGGAPPSAPLHPAAMLVDLRKTEGSAASRQSFLMGSTPRSIFTILLFVRGRGWIGRGRCA